MQILFSWYILSCGLISMGKHIRFNKLWSCLVSEKYFKVIYVDRKRKNAVENQWRICTHGGIDGFFNF